MASIKKVTSLTGTKSWEVRIQMKGFKPVRKRFENKTLAARWAVQTEAAMKEDRHFPENVGSKRTLKDAVTRYIREIMPSKAAGTQSTDGARLRWWVEQIGQLYLKKITSAVVASCRDKLLNEGSGCKGKGPCSPTTARKYIMILEHLFHIAVNEWQWLREAPFRVQKPKPNPGRVRYLTDEERERLLTACRESESPYLYSIISLLLATGARWQEVAKLKWEQIDLVQGEIQLDAAGVKTRKARALHLTGAGLELVRRMAGERATVSEYVFPSVRDMHRPIGYLAKAWQRVCRKAGVKNFRVHDCRHDFASRMIKGGASLAEVAELLGHAGFEMVSRYAHLDKGHIRKVIEKINGLKI